MSLYYYQFNELWDDENNFLLLTLLYKKICSGCCIYTFCHIAVVLSCRLQYCRYLHEERAIGKFISETNGPINLCDFIRYLLIYGPCLIPPLQMAAEHRLYKIYRCNVKDSEPILSGRQEGKRAWIFRHGVELCFH